MNQIGGQRMNREEFGIALYEAITYCSGVQQLIRMIASAVNSGKDAGHVSERYKIEKVKAKAMLESDVIGTEDAVRLVKDYPWLLS